LVPAIATLWTSPLGRAFETAAILGELYGAKPEILASLAPGGAAESTLAALRQARSSASPPVVVGHEPSLSHLVGWLLAGEARSLVELKKGAACLLRFEGEPVAGAATLRWLLQPRVLRRLGR
jgi:phosphohistidine phosphatase